MFEPKGEFSYPELVYRAIRDRATGEVIPYHELPFGREIINGVREKVSKRFEREQRRHVVNVRGLGWKIVQGVDHRDAGVRKRRQATRRLGRSLQILTTVDRQEMSAEEQQRTDDELIATRTGYALMRGLAVRPTLGIEEIVRWKETHPDAN